jgi:putative transposase
VRGSVEETLNAMLDAEAERVCNAGRYEGTELGATRGQAVIAASCRPRRGTLRWRSKLRLQTFETAIIERYRRQESSVEKALIEMYSAGLSVRRVEDITEAPWGARVSPSTVSKLNKKIYASIEAWRMRPTEGEHPYL